jgi:hypothetical protein
MRATIKEVVRTVDITVMFAVLYQGVGATSVVVTQE